MSEEIQRLEKVIVVGYGIQKRMTLTSAIAKVSYESIQDVSLDQTQEGLNSSIQIRGTGSISGNSEPLYLIDGVVVQGNPMDQLPPDSIESIQTLKEASSVAIYGSRGSNGIVVITTKKGLEEQSEEIEILSQKIEDRITLKSWNPDTPYLKTLQKEKGIDPAYQKYVQIRNEYTNVPSFYLDVADFFEKRNATGIAIQVLTNLMEVELDNHELMKALAYKLGYFGKYELAVMVYEKILTLRPEEPQSYRDLALAYEQVGAFQKSFDLLYKIYNGDLLEKDEDERFLGIEGLAYVEINRLVHKYKKQLHVPKTIQKKFTKMPVDVRVVIDWNHNDTDIDLWVIDPNEEKGYYSNSETKIGGRLSNDMTEGYGPEEFMLKKAIKGEYKVMIDYYTDNVQKISGPTILKVTMYTNYGRKNESKKVSVVRLDKEEDEVEVGRLRF